MNSNKNINKYNINRNKINNNLTSNISMNKNANISTFNPTNYEGSVIGQKMNETAQNQTKIKTNNENINNTNLDIQKNNYMNNNNEKNVLGQTNNIDNNIGSNTIKRSLKNEKDNCCCVIF